MADSFLSHLDLALLPDSLPAWDAVVFIHAGEADSLLIACSVWCLYGLPGIIPNSRKLQFSSFHMCVSSSSTRLSHAQARQSLYSLSSEHGTPSHWGCCITSFILCPPPLPKGSDLGPYCIYSSCPRADSTFYLSCLLLPLVHVPWHFSHSPSTHSKTLGADEVTTSQLITC